MDTNKLRPELVGLCGSSTFVCLGEPKLIATVQQWCIGNDRKIHSNSHVHRKLADGTPVRRDINELTNLNKLRPGSIVCLSNNMFVCLGGPKLCATVQQ